MRHDEAEARLSDLALEPGRLDRLERDSSADAGLLRAHISVCQRCSADLAGWRRTWAAIGAASSVAGGGHTAAGGPLGALRLEPDVVTPARLRAATLAAVAIEGRDEARPAGPAGSGMTTTAPAIRDPRASRASRARWASPWLAAAAALVIAVGAGGVAWVRSGELDRARAESVGLASATATLDRVLNAPVHWVMPLVATGGAPGGTVAWSADLVVVITSGLAHPQADQTYRCWVERDGTRTPVGSMSFSGSTGYWAGSMQGWSGALAPGARFGVSLASASGESAPVLVGTP